MSYDKWWDSAADVDMGGTDDTIKEHAVKVWVPGHRGEVLEIGCGKGRLISKFARDFSLNSYIGYDPSLRLLSQAPVLKNVSYVNKLPDMKFQFIYCMLVFQHIPDLEKHYYIRWAGNHLMPQGIFRFQYVNEGEFGPRNFPAKDSEMALYCMEAGLEWEITQDNKYPQWSWCTATLK